MLNHFIVTLLKESHFSRKKKLFEATKRLFFCGKNSVFFAKIAPFFSQIKFSFQKRYLTRLFLFGTKKVVFFPRKGFFFFWKQYISRVDDASKPLLQRNLLYLHATPRASPLWLPYPHCLHYSFIKNFFFFLIFKHFLGKITVDYQHLWLILLTF